MSEGRQSRCHESSLTTLVTEPVLEVMVEEVRQAVLLP